MELIAMKTTSEHTISEESTIRDALEQINMLGEDLVLFVIDKSEKMVGTLTDGDIRRALLQGHKLSDGIKSIMHIAFRYLSRKSICIEELARIRAESIELVPILDENKRIVELVNLRTTRSILPVQAVIMAGGEGRRLRPQTEATPKPLLQIGGKPIIGYNIDHLARYGIKNITISIRYLGQQLRDAFGDGSSKGLNIDYIEEGEALGTIGCLSLIESTNEDTVLVMNSDLLTNIDFEDFYREFAKSDATLAVATIPYKIDIPYAVLETNNGNVSSLKEKPSYVYFANAGIYLMKKEALERIPKGEKYNATDLIDTLIENGKNVLSYPLRNYWLDIGKPDDFKKAEEDIKHINF